MTSNHAAAAKLIRAELKKHGIKGRVRSSSYAGGSSINVKLVDDLPPATVKAVEAFAGRFQRGNFNGMTDCYEYSNVRQDIPQVSYVFVSADFSDEITQAAWDWARGYWAGMDEAPESYTEARGWYNSRIGYDGAQFVHRALAGIDGEFWAARKPRVRAK